MEEQPKIAIVGHSASRLENAIHQLAIASNDSIKHFQLFHESLEGIKMPIDEDAKAKIIELAATAGQGYGTAFEALEDAINVPNLEQRQRVFQDKPLDFLYLRGDTAPRVSKHSKARQERFKARNKKK